MLALLIVALFGNMAQLQLKYDHCKTDKFEGDYCVIQKKLNSFEKK